jgi:phage terminase small subunit
MNIHPPKLTPKQEAFSNAYVATGNASEAYRRAFSAGAMKPETVNRKAIELLSNGKITARVGALQAELKGKSDVTKERVLAELAKVGFADTDNLSAKIKALEVINKMLGFNEPVRSDITTGGAAISGNHIGDSKHVVIFKDYSGKKEAIE